MRGRLHTREDSGLVLDAEGRWTHDGEPVRHPKIVEAFHRGLERAPDGRYILRFGHDWAYVRVEGTPLQVVAALPADSRVHLKFSNDQVEPLRPETLSVWQGVLYCVSAAGLPARFNRSAQFALGSLLEEGAGSFFLSLGGRTWPVPEKRPDPPLPPSPSGA